MKNWVQNKTFELTPTLRFWSLFLPFVCWLGLHQWGAVGTQIDNAWYAHWTVYHFHYLTQGIYPLWDPYHAWGWPDLTDKRFFGEFNPLYLIIPLLTAFHLSPYLAFDVFLMVFYWIGCLGFYFLVKLLWGKEFAALLAYGVLMFSAIGELLLQQLAVFNILFSTVWFFFFLIGFFQSEEIEGQKRFFYGIILVLMIILTTYLPFFFVFILMAVALGVLLTCPKFFAAGLQRIKSFIMTCPKSIFLGTALIALSLLPVISWYLASKNGQMVMITGRNGFSASGGVVVGANMVNQSGLTEQISPSEIFADLDFSVYNFFYIPVFLLIMLSLGLFTRMDWLQRAIFIAAFFVLAFSLGGCMPLYPFLYKYVFFFQMIRNLYFLGPIFIAMLMAIAVIQFEHFLESRPTNRPQQLLYTFFIVLVHGAWAGIFILQEHHLWSSYATMAFSMVMCTAYVWGCFDNKGSLFLIILFFLLILQPAQGMFNFDSRYGYGRPDPQVPNGSFSYLRPLRGADPQSEVGFNEGRPKDMQDESGFFKNGYYGCRNSYLLYSHVPAEILEKYVRYKFVIYDQTVYMDPGHPDWDAISASLKNGDDRAWVDKKVAENSVRGSTQDRAKMIMGPSQEFLVKAFTPNGIQIQTHFSGKKFLVYNDSYSAGWRAFVNGRAVPLFLANMAFKGIWLDRGPQNIEFRFGSPIRYAMNWALEFIFVFWAGYILFLFFGNKTCKVWRKN